MAEDRRLNNPFATLGALTGITPEPEAAPAMPDTAAGPRGPAPSLRVPRAVVRLERAGRSGKDVTVVEHLGLHDEVLAQWLKDVKRALGCGGVIEGGAIVLQGDHRTRLPAWLSARGVRKVTIG
jgi:translation initiation factor 1